MIGISQENEHGGPEAAPIPWLLGQSVATSP